MTGALLSAKNLGVAFARSGGQGYFPAVDGLDIEIAADRVTGLVGESGCGKSVFARAALRLEEGASVSIRGQLFFDGTELLSSPPKTARSLRGKEIGLVFQDPASALHPLLTVGAQLREPIGVHLGLGRRQANELAASLLARVGVPEPAQRLRQYPHELSGGLCQRVMIAIALAANPRLLIADEPTTALDMASQARVLSLLSELSGQGMAILLISHDLGAVAKICDHIAVMYLGHLVEEAPAKELLQKPAHPYTRALLAARPPMRGPKPEELPTIAGQAVRGDSACRFAPRCPSARERCLSENPPYPSGPHRARCFWPSEAPLEARP
jgi:oligopeptide/dipeptide ABC transporter ATP-binding protein